MRPALTRRLARPCWRQFLRHRLEVLQRRLAPAGLRRWRPSDHRIGLDWHRQALGRTMRGSNPAHACLRQDRHPPPGRLHTGRGRALPEAAASHAAGLGHRARLTRGRRVGPLQGADHAGAPQAALAVVLQPDRSPCAPRAAHRAWRVHQGPARFHRVRRTPAEDRPAAAARRPAHPRRQGAARSLWPAGRAFQLGPDCHPQVA